MLSSLACSKSSEASVITVDPDPAFLNQNVEIYIPGSSGLVQDVLIGVTILDSAGQIVKQYGWQQISFPNGLVIASLSGWRWTDNFTTGEPGRWAITAEYHVASGETITTAGSFTINAPVEETSPAISDELVEIMKMAPYDAESLFFMDWETIVQDTDSDALKTMYDFFHDSLANFNMQPQDITTWSAVNESIYILKGEINENEIRSWLQEAEIYQQADYYGVEIWRSNSGWEGFVFLEGMFIFGNGVGDVEKLIRVAMEQEDSLYENNDVRTVVENTPSGPITCILKDGTIFWPRVEGLNAGSISINSHPTDKYMLRVQGWYAYQTDTIAERSLNHRPITSPTTPVDVEIYRSDYYSQFPLEIQNRNELYLATADLIGSSKVSEDISLSLIQEGRFVRVEGQVNVGDFIDSSVAWYLHW